MSQAWVVGLTGVGASGDLKQLYPDFAPVGVAKASAVHGDQIRTPTEGKLHSVQVRTDGINGGVIEMWDLNGAEVGANVSSLAAVTDAQLTAMIASGRARRIFEQDFVASDGAETVGIGQFRTFAKGLAARFVGSGTCTLNMVVTGGYRLNETAG